MAVIVQKFGGTSVGSLERIETVAEHVIATRQQGHQVVVVLSAMSGETNRLINLAKTLDKAPSPRELDMLLATGEQVSISLLAIALIQRGYSAVSLLGHQAGVQTNNRAGHARILKVENERLLSELEQGHVVIVAGFQGVDLEGNITTLGRGGSDTSAVAIASAIDAAECQIYTDVDGVYTTDPRIVSDARKLDVITFEEMLELASLGAKVLQIRAVELAGKFNLPLRVLSSFQPGAGTMIGYEGQGEIDKPVSGIAYQQGEALFTLCGLKSITDVQADLFTALGELDIEVDMITQGFEQSGDISLSFTVNSQFFEQSRDILHKISKKYAANAINVDSKLAKISAVGNGMKSHAGVAGVMFSTLAKENIAVRLISTSEIKISVLVEEKYLELAVRALHSAFGLSSES